MAKGKHATALFEVIHNAKLSEKTDKASMLKTPKWWFKGKSATAPSAPAPAHQTATASRPRADESSTPPAIIIFDTEPEGFAPSVSTAGDPTAGRDASNLLRSHSVAAAAPVAVAADPEQQQITVKVSYISALIGGFAVVVIVGLAYVIGSHMTRGPASAMGQSVEQLRSGKPAPGVLRVGQGGERVVTNDPAPQETRATPEQNSSGSGANGQATGGAGGPAAPLANGKRIVGMQYVVVQSYPDEADAKAAVDLLGKNGIGASVQQGFWPARPTWYTVIGTREFDHIRSNPEFDKYLKSINDLSSRFAGTSKFKRFEPMAVKWKDTN
jgi:hypothetical protein